MSKVPVDLALSLLVGPIIDSTDFKTLETVAWNAAGLVVKLLQQGVGQTDWTTTTLTLTDPGSPGDNDWEVIADGRHNVEITAIENATPGKLQIVGVADGVLPFQSNVYEVVTQAAYDDSIGSTDRIGDILTDTAAIDGRLPSDPADASIVAAGAAATLAAVNGLNDPDTTAIAAAVEALQAGIHGAGSWSPVTGTGSQSITIHTQTAAAVTIQEAFVSVWADAAHTNLHARVQTDANGDFAGLGIDPGTYFYTAVKASHTFVSGTFTVTVDATHNIIGVVNAPGVPTRPDGCIVAATIWDGELNPRVGVTIVFRPVVPAKIGGALLDQIDITKTTDDDGQVTAELGKTKTYLVIREEVGLREPFVVPDADNFDITDLVN